MASKDSILNIILNIVKHGTGAEDTKGALSGLGDQLSNVATGILGNVIGFTSLAGATWALYNGLKEDVAEAAAAELTLARLGATVQSTGRSSETSTVQIHSMAEGMRGLFTTEDIEKAANALMRFMDIPTSAIPGDLQLIKNMAAGLGVTLPEAANTLGMALETGRLRGLGFSREMQNTISTMMSQGDIAGADTIIMDQLNQKFSGQEAAQIATYTGATEALASSMNDLDIAVGDRALPALTVFKVIAADAVEYLTKYITSSGDANAQNQLSSISTDELNKDYAALNDSLSHAQDHTTAFGIAVAMGNIRTELQGRSIEILDGNTIKYTGDLAWLNNITVENTKTTIDDGAAHEALRKQLVDQTGWEAMYTGEKDAAGRIKDSLSMLGGDLQGLGTDGATVWEGFLEATGKISPAAAKQFVEIQNDFQTVKSMLAQGIAVDVVVKWLVDQTNAEAAASAPAVTSGSGTKTLAPWATQQDKDFANKHPEIYAVPPGGFAHGGSVEPNSYLWNEDPSTRPEMFVSDGGHILTNQDARAALGGGGSPIVMNVTYSPMISFADEYTLMEHLYPLLDKAIQRSKGRI